MLKKRQKVGYTVIDLEHPYTIGEDFSGLLEHHPGYLHLLDRIANMIYIIKIQSDERILEKHLIIL